MFLKMVRGVMVLLMLALAVPPMAAPPPPPPAAHPAAAAAGGRKLLTLHNCPQHAVLCVNCATTFHVPHSQKHLDTVRACCDNTGDFRSYCRRISLRPWSERIGSRP